MLHLQNLLVDFVQILFLGGQLCYLLGDQSGLVCIWKEEPDVPVENWRTIEIGDAIDLRPMIFKGVI